MKMMDLDYSLWLQEKGLGAIIPLKFMCSDGEAPTQTMPVNFPRVRVFQVR